MTVAAAVAAGLMRAELSVAVVVPYKCTAEEEVIISYTQTLLGDFYLLTAYLLKCARSPDGTRSKMHQ